MSRAMRGGKGDELVSPAFDPHADSSRPTVYQVRVAGQLHPRWARSFEGMTVTLDGADTLITGPVVDQAALHGLLKRLRDLGVPLISVGPLHVDGEPTSTESTNGSQAR